MHILLMISLAFANLKLTPDQMVVHPNQCVEVTIHFQGGKEGEARHIILSSNHPKVGVFASRDCSGGFETTISAGKENFYFTIQPLADIPPGTYTVNAHSTLKNHSELGSFTLKIK